MDRLREFYKETETSSLNTISYLQADIGEMARIREEYPDNWEIEELTRVIMFDEAQMVELFRKEVESAREAQST